MTWPWNRWRVRVKQSYHGDQVDVVLARRFRVHSLKIAVVPARAEDFDLRLIEAVAEARARAIALNGESKRAQRRLPA